MKATPIPFHPFLLVALACLASLLPGAHAHGKAIGTLKIDGSNAFIDDVKQRPSVSGVPVQDGNMVRTGQRTSAWVDLVPQGEVKLNENSAKLITLSFFKGARCVAVQLMAGELYINGENVCFVTNVGPVSGISRSRINIKVDERGTVLTVIEGAAELEGKPASMLVSTSEQLVVLTNGQYFKNPIDPAAAERTAEWTKQYFNAPQKKKMSKGAKAALGVLGAILIGTAIHKASDDDDDDKPHQPPTPSSEPSPYPPVEQSPPSGDANPQPAPSPAVADRLREPSPRPRVYCCSQVNGQWSFEEVDALQCNGYVMRPDEVCPPVR